MHGASELRRQQRSDGAGELLRRRCAYRRVVLSSWLRGIQGLMDVSKESHSPRDNDNFASGGGVQGPDVGRARRGAAPAP
jgi:hypothetical protein